MALRKNRVRRKTQNVRAMRERKLEERKEVSKSKGPIFKNEGFNFPGLYDVPFQLVMLMLSPLEWLKLVMLDSQYKDFVVNQKEMRKASLSIMFPYSISVDFENDRGAAFSISIDHVSYSKAGKMRCPMRTGRTCVMSSVEPSSHKLSLYSNNETDAFFDMFDMTMELFNVTKGKLDCRNHFGEIEGRTALTDLLEWDRLPMFDLDVDLDGHRKDDALRLLNTPRPGKHLVVYGYSPEPEDEFKIVADNLYFHHPSGIMTVPKLIELECRVASYRMSNLTEEEINQFLRYWVTAEQKPMLIDLLLDFTRSIDQDVLCDGLEILEDDETVEKYGVLYERLNPTRSYWALDFESRYRNHFRAADGTMATLIVDDCRIGNSDCSTMQFLVWDQPNGPKPDDRREPHITFEGEKFMCEEDIFPRYGFAEVEMRVIRQEMWDDEQEESDDERELWSDGDYEVHN